jgi:uncharacterized protein (TIGR02118 family)
MNPLPVIMVAVRFQTLLFGMSLSIFPPKIYAVTKRLQNQMIKLIALFKRPPDPEAFDQHFQSVHLPLVKSVPGLRRLEILRVKGAPIGESPYHVMAELTFDSKDAMDEAFATPAGKAVARDLLGFAAKVITVFHGEIEG